MDEFEKYAFTRGYAKYLEIELKRVRVELGKLQSCIQEFEAIGEKRIEELSETEFIKNLQMELKLEKARSTDLLYKLNKETTKNLLKPTMG